MHSSMHSHKHTLCLPKMLKYNRKKCLGKTLTTCSFDAGSTHLESAAPIHVLSDELPQEKHGKNMFNSHGPTKTAPLSSACKTYLKPTKKTDRHRSKTSCSQGHPQNHLPSPRREVLTSILRGLPSTRRIPAACERSRGHQSSIWSGTIPMLST